MPKISEKKDKERIQELELENERLRKEIERLSITENEKERLTQANRLSEMAKLANVGFWEYDVKNDFMILSDEAYRLFDFPIGSNINYKQIIERIHPDDQKMHNEYTQQCIEKGVCEPFEYRLVLSNGNTRFLYANRQIERNDKGEPIKMLGVITDITLRKNTEIELHEYQEKLEDKVAYRTYELESNQQLLSTVISEASIVLFSIDIDGVFTFSDGKALLKLGMEPGQVVGLSVYDVYKDFPEIIESVKKAMQGEEVHVVNNLGGVYFDTAFTPLKYSDRITGVVGVAVEVTEKVIYEKQLNESNKRFRGAFDYSGIGMAIVDLDGKWLEINQALQQIVGYDEKELLNTTFQEITHPDDLKLDRVHVNELIQGKKDSYKITKRYFHKNGHIVWVQLNSSIIRNEFGEPLFFIIQIIDISEKIKYQEEIEQYTRKLENSNQELEQFAYVASHDLQEPLRKIKSFSQMLGKKVDAHLDEKTRGYMNSIHNAVSRMQALINDLLSYSRVSSQGKEFETVDLNNVVTEVLEILDVQINKSAVVLDVHNLPSIEADENQMIQLIQNLITNAIKFNDKDNPKIEIGIKDENEKQITLFVKDNGIGVDMEYTDKIFTIFQRLHTREKYDGTGIGLSICKKIVERHHGKIWIESIINKETTFNITLPKN